MFLGLPGAAQPPAEPSSPRTEPAPLTVPCGRPVALDGAQCSAAGAGATSASAASRLRVHSPAGSGNQAGVALGFPTVGQRVCHTRPNFRRDPAGETRAWKLSQRSPQPRNAPGHPIGRTVGNPEPPAKCWCAPGAPSLGTPVLRDHRLGRGKCLGRHSAVFGDGTRAAPCVRHSRVARTAHTHTPSV